VNYYASVFRLFAHVEFFCNANLLVNLHAVRRKNSAYFIDPTVPCAWLTICPVPCSNTALHALHILRAHGMCDTALNTVYQAVVIAKLTYATSASWGFTNSADRQRIEVSARRGVRCGFCRSNSLTIEQL